MRVESTSSARLAGLSPAQQALLEKRLRGRRDSGGGPRRIPRCDRAGPLPLSYGQQMLWFLDQFAPGTPLYNLPAALRLRGPLDRDALQRALTGIVVRHEALRTRLVAEAGAPVQVVGAVSEVDLPLGDLAGLPPVRREEELARRMREEAQRPFDLARDLMLRAALFRLAETEHVLLLTMHHTASDGWSLNVLFRELEVFYQAFVSRAAPVLPELPIQYVDFAVWQRASLRGETLERLLACWKRQLAGATGALELPVDRPEGRNPAPAWSCGGREGAVLDARLVGALKDLSRSEGVTLFVTLLAVFKTLLHRYSRQTDVLTGSPVAGRTHADTEGLIGFFVNTLVLRDDLSGNPSFRELLVRVRETALSALANQELPFEKLIEELRPARVPGRTPLVPVMFVLQHTPAQPFRFAGLEAAPMPVDSGAAKFDITLALQEEPRGLVAEIDYNRDLFDAATIRRMLGHFETLLGGVVADRQSRLNSLPLLTPGERRQLLVDWNRTETAFPRDKTIHELFAGQAARAPEAVAVVDGARRMTYRELDARAGELAQRLRELGVGPDVCVGVFLERSLEMIVAMLAALKAGGAYLPLDTVHPPERLAFMLADAAAPVLVTQRALSGTCAAFESKLSSLKRLFLDDLCSASGTRSPVAPRASFSPSARRAPRASDLAYVIYTSGSTGQPKGVAVPHRAVVRLVRNTDYAQLGPDDRVAQASNCSFDAATFEVWGALLNGGRLVIVPKDIVLSPRDYVEQLRRDGVTAMFITTALFNQMAREVPGAFRTLRHVLFGGEAADPRPVASVLRDRPPQRLLHVYGPTETTTFATWHEVRAIPEGARTIPIGRPIANTTLHVLDERHQPVPIGVPGELYIGGDGVARGYLNRPELTAERFVPAPFAADHARRRGGADQCEIRDPRSEIQGELPAPCVGGDEIGGDRGVLYKTGDLVRYLADGSIEFIGRLDNQVKIRGFRVEPAEIEAALSRHPAVSACAVVPHDDPRQGRRLVAYVVLAARSGRRAGADRLDLRDELPPPDVGGCGPQTPTAADGLRPFLQSRLPDYMVPSAFVTLDALPLSPNGKVDRRALPAPDGARPEFQKTHIAPRDHTERELAKVWEEVLGVRPVGVGDKFFDLGGHSLLAVQLVTRIENRLGKRLPVAAVFHRPTIGQMAPLLREGGTVSAAAESSIVEIQAGGARAPMFFVHGVGGGMFWGYANLARHLGSDQPVFAFKSRGLDGREELGTIEAMAAQYVAELRAFRPQGPYLLGGYCFGGDVAYEMALQLREQGVEAALLALMNCAPPNSSYTQPRLTPAWLAKFLRNLGGTVLSFLRWSRAHRREFVRWRWRSLKAALGRRLSRAGAQAAMPRADELVDLSACPDDQRALWDAHIRALARYRPRPFTGRVTLFRSRIHPLFCSFDERYGWGELAGDVSVRIVPGEHESILEEPNVASLAAQLRHCLDELDPHPQGGRT